MTTSSTTGNSSTELNAVRDVSLLRNALKLDGIATTPTGILLLALSGMLDSALGLPATLLAIVGGFCVVYGAAVFLLGTRPRPARPAALVVIAINLVWVLDSALLLSAGWFEVTTLGVVVVCGLAVAVGGLAALQAYALRR